MSSNLVKTDWTPAHCILPFSEQNWEDFQMIVNKLCPLMIDNLKRIDQWDLQVDNKDLL